MLTPLRASLDGQNLRQHQANSLQTAVAQAKQDQLEAIAQGEAKGDSLAAYWAGSASASVMAHYRRGAVVNVGEGTPSQGSR